MRGFLLDSAIEDTRRGYGSGAARGRSMGDAVVEQRHDPRAFAWINDHRRAELEVAPRKEALENQILAARSRDQLSDARPHVRAGLDPHGHVAITVAQGAQHQNAWQAGSPVDGFLLKGPVIRP